MLALPHPGCTSWGMSTDLSMPQCPHLKKRMTPASPGCYRMEGLQVSPVSAEGMSTLGVCGHDHLEALRELGLAYSRPTAPVTGLDTLTEGPKK